MDSTHIKRLLCLTGIIIVSLLLLYNIFYKKEEYPQPIKIGEKYIFAWGYDKNNPYLPVDAKIITILDVKKSVDGRNYILYSYKYFNGATTTFASMEEDELRRNTKYCNNTEVDSLETIINN